MPVERVQWTCPVCKRRYAIPATAPTPSRCPQCRQAEEEAAARAAHAPLVAEAIIEPVEQANESDIRIGPTGGSTLSALAAIQLEVAEEASRGPSAPLPIVRHVAPAFKRLEAIATIYTALAGLAVVGAVGALAFGMRQAFVMPATAERTQAIFLAMGEFAGGLIVALGFFAFREVIYLLLAIEENARRGRDD